MTSFLPRRPRLDDPGPGVDGTPDSVPTIPGRQNPTVPPTPGAPPRPPTTATPPTVPPAVPPAIVPPSEPLDGGPGGGSTFGPGNNLLGTQFQFQSPGQAQAQSYQAAQAQAAQLADPATVRAALAGDPQAIQAMKVGAQTDGLRRIAEKLGGLQANYDSPYLAKLMQQQQQAFGGPGITDLVSKAFESQQGVIDQRFKDQVSQLNRRTAALGRTGGGFVNSEGQALSEGALAAREALLGRLAFQGAQADQQNRQALLGIGQGLAGQEFGRQRGAFTDTLGALRSAGGLEGQAAGLQLQGDISNQRTGLEAARANQASNLQTALANAGFQNQASQFNAGAQNQFGLAQAGFDQQAALANAAAQNQASQFNANQQLAAFGLNQRNAFAENAFNQRERDYQAQQNQLAQQNELERLRILGQGI